MRGLLAVLRRKLGLIRSSGRVEILEPGPRGDGSFTCGSPSFVWTETGIEGPFWPSLRSNFSWDAGSPPREEDGSPSAEPWCYSI
jgi:hypothetical protein